MVATHGPSFLPPAVDDTRPTPPLVPFSHGPRPSQAGNELGEPGLDRQLAGLFGETVFGPLLDPGRYLSRTSPSNARRGRLRRFVILLLILGVGGATTWLIRAGSRRTTGVSREQTAQSLANFLNEGEMPRVAQFLLVLHDPKQPFDSADPFLDLMVRGEAAVYRYLDADPSRLARIRTYLPIPEGGAGSPQRLLASLAVASRQERAERLAELESIGQIFERDPEYHYLLATALEHKGDVQAARRAWERSQDLGPLWLGHRYEQAGFEAAQRNRTGVRKVVEGLARVAPTSLWTQLASERFLGVRAVHPDKAPGQTPDPAFANVAAFQRDFALALSAAGDQAVAWRRLSQAVAAVNGQSPFVLDAFDWLMAAKATGLARALTGFEAWPRHSKLALARLAMLDEHEQPRDDKSTVAPAATHGKAATPSTTIKKKKADKPQSGKHKARRRQ
jgi:hypothetical protein